VVTAKNINQAPFSDDAQCFALRLAEEDSALPENGIVHITRLRRNIEIAAQNEWLVCGTSLIEITAETRKPR
jgi:hypothetical protein